jgi:hypothetical protein
MFVSYDPNFRNSTISDFWDKSFISIAESKNIIFYGIVAFAIEGPTSPRGYLIRLVCGSRNTQHAFLLMAFGLSLLVELLRNAP